MITIAYMENMLSQLRTKDTIPGLSKDAVVDAYVEEQFKDNLDSCESEEERKRRKQEFVDYYITGPGKRFIEENIANLQFMYSQVVSGLAAIKKSAEQVTASNTVPSVITTGSASSTPNPAYTAIENSQKKQALLAQITTVTDFIAQLLGYAILLYFILPEEVFIVIGTLSVITSIINLIPG